MGPEIRRKKKEVQSSSVHLAPELWAALTDTAAFATEAFAATGKPEIVSRNDLIEELLIWGLDAYWEDKGGRPTTPKERAEKVAKLAARLKK